ncbi:MAG: cation:proton antiporter, partial [Candidatus Paceibacterota bacterium]
MHIFLEIGLILFVVTIVTSLARLFKQPLVVGYILSGILVGPYVLDLLQGQEYIELFSKLGIALLLFIVGLNLKPEIVREVGKVSLVTGLGQIVFTSGIGFFIMKMLGFSTTASLYGAIALTFSSTIIILKLLGDKGDLYKLYGKISVGFLLVQDLVATLILLVISIWGSASLESDAASTEMKVFFLITKGLAAFFVVYVLGKYVFPKLSKFLSESQEYLFMVSLTWGIGIAALFYHFGFSLEIGALIAGISLSTSIFAQEISSKMKPLQDFFILQFFVLLGAQMIISDIHQIMWPAIILSLFVLIGNPLIVLILMNILGFKN